MAQIGLAPYARTRPRPGVAQRPPEWTAQRVRQAALGDRHAWNELVDEFAGMVSAVARRHGLCHADVADVMQTTWLRLAENLHRLKDPSRVGAWLATTARRECLRTVRNLARELPGEESLEPAGAETPPVDERLLESERDAALWSALERLPARDQALLRMLVTEPQPSYEQVGSALGMPVGSIGPTRARALDRLRYELERGEMAA